MKTREEHPRMKDFAKPGAHVLLFSVLPLYLFPKTWQRFVYAEKYTVNYFWCYVWFHGVRYILLSCCTGDAHSKLGTITGTLQLCPWIDLCEFLRGVYSQQCWVPQRAHVTCHYTLAHTSLKWLLQVLTPKNIACGKIQAKLGSVQLPCSCPFNRYKEVSCFNVRLFDYQWGRLSLHLHLASQGFLLYLCLFISFGYFLNHISYFVLSGL